MKRYLLYFLFLLSSFIKIYSQTDTAFWFAAPYIDVYHQNSPTPYWGGQPSLFRIASAVTFPTPTGSTSSDTSSNYTTVTIEQPANKYSSTNTTGFKTMTFKLNYYRKDTSVDMTKFMNYISSSSSSTWSKSSTSAINYVTPDSSERNTVLSKGFHITSSQNITAYWDLNNSYNSDIFSLKGKHALGTDFYTSFQNTWNNASDNTNGSYREFCWSTINIIATENGTTVTIVTSSTTQATNPTKTAVAKGTTITVTLNKGQTYVIRSNSHLGTKRLGGTYIHSTKPIAVTSNDDSVYADGGADDVGDQIIPTSVIGKEYIVMRTQVLIAPYSTKTPTITEGKPTGERCYFIATTAGTKIWINGTNTAHLYKTLAAAGDTCSYLLLNNATYINSNYPIYVWHVGGFVNELGGAQIPSIEGCSGSLDVSFIRSRLNDESFKCYVNLMIKNGYQQFFHLDKPDGTSIQLKNNPLCWDTVQGTSGTWVTLRDTAKDFTNIITSSKVYKIRNTLQAFHMGLITGKASNTCKYGYFSSFGVDSGAASIKNNAADAYQGCYGDSIYLTASGGTAYAWGLKEKGSSLITGKYLNDSTLADPIATPPPGAYDYIVTITRPCLGPIDILVKVSIAPQVVPKVVADPYSACSPYTNIKFTNSSVVDTMPKYYWHFNYKLSTDPIVYMYNTDDTTFYYKYPANTTNSPVYYYVRLDAVSRMYTGCSESVIKKITILPEIHDSISPIDTSGCNPVTVAFRNLSTGNIDSTSYYWDFGDVSSTSEKSPTHVFTNPYGTVDSIYHVSMILTSPYYCRDTAYSTVKVHPYIEPDFTIDTVKGCSPLTIRIQDNSKGPIDAVKWDFGDGTTSTTLTKGTSFTHTYKNTTTLPVTYKLTLTISTGGYCTQSQIREIIVYPEITLGILPLNTTGCNPDTVNFQSVITPSTHVTIADYSWSFGDGGTSNNANPTHIYSNTGNGDSIRNVKLITTTVNGCQDTATTTVTIEKYIKAKFTVDKTDSCADFTVTITSPLYNSLSTNATYTWDYGDGSAGPSNPKLQYYTHTYKNSGNTIKTYLLKLTVTAGACSDSLTDTIKVYPKVTAIAIASPTEGCNPLTVKFTNTTDAAVSASYYWDFKDGVTSADQNPTHQFINLTGNTETYNVTLTATTPYQCTSNITIPILVYPYIKASFSVDTAKGCSPFTVGINNVKLPGIVKYHWNYGYVGIDTAEYNSNARITHAYPTNNTASPVTYRLLLTVTNTGNCTDTVSHFITVYPLVTAKFDVDTQACHPYNATFQNNSIYANYYTWDFGDGNTSTSTATSVYNTYYNWGVKDTTYTATLTASSIYNCSDTKDTDVLVKFKPLSKFTVSSYASCPPLIDTLTNKSVGTNLHYKWNFNVGVQATDSAYTSVLPIIKTFTIDTARTTLLTYIISLRAISQTGCYDDDTISVKVYPKVTARMAKDTSKGCNPVTINFRNNTNQLISNNFTWNFGDQTGSTSTAVKIPHQYTNLTAKDTTYKVWLAAVSPYNCTDTVRTTITLYPYIEANFTLDTAKGCSPFSTTISSYQPGGITQYNWDFGDGTTDTTYNNNSFSHSFPVDSTNSKIATYQVKLTVQNHISACTETTSKTVSVYPLVVAKFDVDTSECTPYPAVFYNKSKHAYKYTWDFGDGNYLVTTADTVYNTYYNWGTADSSKIVQLTATSIYNCVRTYDTTIWINHKPKALFSEADNVYEHCPPFNARFKNSSEGSNLTYTWKFDQGRADSVITSAATFSKIFSIPDAQGTIQVYNVRLHVASNKGCYDDDSVNIKVYPKVTAIFTSDTAHCTPFPVQFSNTTLHARDYEWTFGDGYTSQDNSPLHTYYNYAEQDTTYHVDMVATSLYGCVDSAQSIIYVYHVPKSIFSVLRSDSCPPFDVTVYNNSYGTNVSYYWTMGDNTDTTTYNKTTFRHWYDNPASNSSTKSYTINLKVTNNNYTSCTNSSSTLINVYPKVTALFSPDTSGCNPLTVPFSNTTTNADYYYWSFGDGTISGLLNPSNRFVNTSVNDTTFSVFLKATSKYECTDTITHTVTVYPAPDADFSVLPTLKVYPDATFTIVNETNAGYWDYTWDFGDGSPTSTVEDPGTYTYAHWGSYTITLNAVGSHSCSSSVSYTITLVAPDPIATFDSTCEGCVPYTARFYNSSKYGNTYVWDFGDSTSYEGYEPGEHTYDTAGIYHVKLTVTGDGGVEETYQTVTVFKKPVVGFTLSPDTAMLVVSGKTKQAMVKCYNTSDYGTSYLWNFGDTSTSIEYQPVHYYKNLGLYPVSLKVWTEHSCTDSLTKTALIIGEGIIEFPNAFKPSSSGPSGGAYTSPYTNNDIFHPNWQGIEEYKLEIYTRWGQKIFESDDVNIGWDGYFRGKLSKEDVYVWKAQGKFTNGATFSKAGDVTLLR